jgi:hypothetical protein
MFCIGFFETKTCAQQSNVVSGANATGTGGISNYSIGQIIYTTANGSAGSTAQGVQQAFEILTLGKDNFLEITLQMVVYPNPTTSFVNLRIDTSTLLNISAMKYQLYDIQGRAIAQKKITNSETPIDLQNLPSATYLLQIINGNKAIKTFKIIKNN